MINNLKIGVIVPTLNEERNLPLVLKALPEIGIDEILVLDGNSADGTVKIAKDFGVNVALQDGNGKGNAICQAFSNDYLDVDAVILLDADGSMKPDEIPHFVTKLRSGFDIVKGSRFMKGGHSEDMNILRKIGNLFFILLVRVLWADDITDLCYGYIAFRKESVKKLGPVLKSQNFEIETEVFIKAKKLGLSITEVPSIELARKHGKSNLRAFKDGFRILRTIIYEIMNPISTI